MVLLPRFILLVEFAEVINPLDSTRGELLGVDFFINPLTAALLLDLDNAPFGNTGFGATAGFGTMVFFSHELLAELGLFPLLVFFLLSIACFSAFSCRDRTAEGSELDLLSEEATCLLTADFL